VDKLIGLKFVFENCTVAEIAEENIVNASFYGIKESYSSGNYNNPGKGVEIYSSSNCTEARITINNISKIKFDSPIEGAVSLKERLKYKDITSVELRIRKGNEIVEKDIYVPWGGTEFTNHYMKLKFDNSCDEVHIFIKNNGSWKAWFEETLFDIKLRWRILYVKYLNYKYVKQKRTK